MTVKAPRKPRAVKAPSAPVDQLGSAIRTLVLSSSVVVALAGFATKRDILGFVTYVQSSEFLTAASAVTTIATIVWSQWQARRRAK